MKSLINILDILALVIQLTGSIIMFRNSPINRVTGTQLGGDYDKELPKLKNYKLKVGFLLLAVGIFISIVSLLLKDFGFYDG
jgi:hypothetical protein